MSTTLFYILLNLMAWTAVSMLLWAGVNFTRLDKMPAHGAGINFILWFTLPVWFPLCFGHALLSPSGNLREFFKSVVRELRNEI